MTRPNLFIVGAPKSGTSAISNYLSQHIDIFMATKELHYFGYDLPLKYRISEPEYLQYFNQASTEMILGDKSVWYLFSKTAALEIKDYAPDARIVIMLRNPVTLLHSLHSQEILDGNEDIADFEIAIHLDDERRKGNKQPNCVDFTYLPPYKDVALFSEQVKRYLDVFGKEKVHIIIYEEFANDPEASIKKVLSFLGIDSDIKIQYKVINPNKKIRFLFLHRLIKKPAGWLRKIIRILIPVKKVRHRIMSYLQESNITEKKREEMNPVTEKYLKDYFADDIAALSRLINKDLTAIWK